MVLGFMFLGNQFYEWVTQTTRWSTNAFGSLFYIMSGLHGLHVFIGLIAMTFLLGRMKGPAGDPGGFSRAVEELLIVALHLPRPVLVGGQERLHQLRSARRLGRLLQRRDPAAHLRRGPGAAQDVVV